MRFPLPEIKKSGQVSPVVGERQIIHIFFVWKMLHEVLAPRQILLLHLHLGTVYIRDFPCTIFDPLDTHLLSTVLPATMLISNPGFCMVLLYAKDYAIQ